MPKHKHKHKQAFCRVPYVAPDGSEAEKIWNSRDGMVPNAISSAVTGEILVRADRYGSYELVYMPNYMPEVGERIFVDWTEQRARILAAELVEEQERNPALGAILVQQAFGSREAAVQAVFESIWERLERIAAVDILVVTAGYIEELKARRAEQGAAMLNIEAPLVVHPQPAVDVLDELSDVYDREGTRISFRRWGELLETPDYQRVAITAIEQGPGKPALVVSTVWLGINHRFGDEGLPIIFETMVYEAPKDSGAATGDRAANWLDEQERYCTEAEALEGHKRMVAKYTS